MHSTTSFRSARCCLICCAVFCLPASHVQAQPTQATLDTVTVQSEAAQETARGPVSGYRAKRAVSATKTDTPLAETPQSVTVVTRDQITEQGMGNLQDLLSYAAGVRSDAYGIDGRTDSVRVRGASPITYLDGLRGNYGYYTSTIRPDPYTLERVEVLRGPAGTLYGAGGTGGIVHMTSKRPQFEAGREAGVQLGSHNRRQVQLDLTGPIHEQLAWRIVALARKAGTQVDYVPDNRLLFMPALTWRPRAATTLTLHALWQKDESGSTSQFFPWAGTLYPARPGLLPTRRFIGEPCDHYDTRRAHAGWELEHTFSPQWQLRQNYRYSRNTNDGLYHYADFFTLVGGWGADPVNQRILKRIYSDTRTQNAMHLLDTHLQGRLVTGSLRHTLLAGLDVIRQHEDSWRAPNRSSTIDAWQPVYGQTVYASTRAAQPRTTQRQTGFYVQDQIQWDAWTILAGLRHDRAAGGKAGAAREKTSATTKRLGVLYASAARIHPYISYAESFEPQAARQGQTFKPLRGKQWEIGLKYEPEGRALALNAALYHLREQNRIRTLRPDVYDQLGETRTRGLELEARGRLAPRLELLAHYNHIRPDAQLEGLPKHQASLWAMHYFGASRQQGFSAGAGLRWMSAFHDRSGPRIPASTLLDFMLAWDAPHWRVALNVTNATDKTYFATCLARGDCWIGARRNVLLSATWRF